MGLALLLVVGERWEAPFPVESLCRAAGRFLVRWGVLGLSLLLKSALYGPEFAVDQKKAWCRELNEDGSERVVDMLSVRVVLSVLTLRSTKQCNLSYDGTHEFVPLGRYTGRCDS